jgi:CubicO group peptidase (beta-lactamase class C family)
MQSSLRVFLVLPAVCLLVSSATAQTRQSTIQRAPSRATLVQAEPSLDNALRDAEVQAAMRQYVRGVDLTAQSRRSRAASGPSEGSVDDRDHPRDPGPILSERQVSALANASPRRAVSSAALSRASGRLANVEPTATARVTPSRTAPSASDILTNELARRLPSNIGDLVAPPTPYLDVNGFGQDLHAALRNSSNGYAMRMRRNGQTIYTLQWNWAQTPSDGSLGWNPDRRMHVASISKFITAMALTQVLDNNGIDYNDPIGPWLPTYWSQGANVGSIRFSDLMNHLSGFGTGGSDGSYATIRSQVQNGVPMNEIGNWNTADYENMNFALCRILIATITGTVNRNAYFGPQFNETMWNALTIQSYENYIRQQVFVPSGINPNGPTLEKPNNPAMAYLPGGGTGWSSGDMTNQAGGVAWHFSLDELLSVAGEFRRGGGIVSPMRAQQILNASYGLNSPINGEASPAGRFYYKPGLWRNGSLRTEQAFLMMLPENIEVAIFVNSGIGAADGSSLQALGRTLYVNNVIEP